MPPVSKKRKSQPKPVDSDSASDSSGPTDRTVSNAVHKAPPKESTDGPKASGSDSKNQYRIKEEDGLPTWQLDTLRTIKVSEFKGKQYVNIREFYEKDGKKLPGKKGISLTPAQWKILVACVDDISTELKG